MAFQVTGILHSSTPTEQKGDNFTLRRFILEVSESNGQGQTYTQYIGFQLVNNNCAFLDSYQVGQPITVSFNLRGKLWEGKSITNLNVWKIEAVAQAAPQYAQPQPQQYAQPAQQYAPQPQPAPQYAPQPQYAQPAPQPAPQQAPAQPAQPAPPAQGGGKLPF